MDDQTTNTIKSQVSLIVEEIQSNTKGDNAALAIAICNLLGAANVLVERNGFAMEGLMQTYEPYWGPVVDALVTV